MSLVDYVKRFDMVNVEFAILAAFLLRKDGEWWFWVDKLMGIVFWGTSLGQYAYRAGCGNSKLFLSQFRLQFIQHTQTRTLASIASPLSNNECLRFVCIMYGLARDGSSQNPDYSED